MDRTRDCLIDLKMHSFKRNLLTPLGGANEKPPSGTGSTFITPEIARTMGSKKEIEKKKKKKIKECYSIYVLESCTLPCRDIRSGNVQVLRRE
jgi:hypothetical protein